MIIICSHEALNPVRVAEVCRNAPSENVYALPWVTTPGELHDNMKLNNGIPDRLFPCEKNTAKAEGESLELYDRLKDDAFGTMADALKHGTPVLNEVMECPCESAFYGRVLTPILTPGATFILKCFTADYYFPTEPLSAKLYAMATVPVMLKNTDEFKKTTGCEDEEVSVMLATDFVPGISAFMEFHKLMSGKNFVCSVDKSKFAGPPPVTWRYNRAYKVT